MANAQLTYLLKIDGIAGDSTIKGFEGYFTVDEFTFNELTRLANGGAGGSSGKAQFDPLMVDIAGLPPGLVTLLKDAATGKHIPSVELVGLKPDKGTLEKVYDLTLNNVTLAGYAADGKHDTALAFDYSKVTETITGQNPDGSPNTGQTFSFDLAHGGGAIASVNHDALAAFAHSHNGPALTYLLKVDGVTGDSTIKGYEGYFTVDEFTFNELTKLANGGAGGSSGKAQFDPLMVDIAGLSPGLVTLLKDAATGKHIPSVELVGLKPDKGALDKVYDLTLNNVTLAGYAADGKHDTALAFDYSKLTETITGQKPDGSPDTGQTFTFDLARGGGSLAPVNHDTLAAFAHSHVGPALTYLLKVDGVTGDSTIKGYEGYFTVDEFTFNELTRLANGGAGGSAGKAQFDPLMVDIAGLSPGLVTLLKDAATGKHIPSVELVGLKPDKGTLEKVYDLTLNNVTLAGYAADSGHDTALAFDYTKLTETIQGQKPDGSLDTGQTFSFDLTHNGGSLAPVNHDTLAAFAHSHIGPALTYLLKVDGVTGDSKVAGYEGYFTVDEFTFNELTKLANGGAGGSAGKAQFDPLMVDIAGLSPGLVTLLKDAATGKHIPSVELVGLKPDKGALEKVYDLTLNNVALAGYAADGGHDTALAFDFTKLTETITGQKPDGSLDTGQTFTFDLAHNGGSIAPVNHDTLAAFAHSHVEPALTYLLKIDGATGDSKVHGYEGYFTVDEFTFNELTKLANGGAGAVAGKAQFDPLTVDIAGLSPGLVTLLKDAATGKQIPSVELVGLKPSGDGPPQKVYDLTLNHVTLAGYAADSGHDTALAFDFSKLTETITGQKPDGSPDTGQTFTFDLAHNGGSIAPVNHDALAAFAHSHVGPALTYLLKVDGVTGDSMIKGYQGDFTVDEFAFNELTRLSNGGAGGSSSKAQFDPLMVDIAGSSPGLVTLLKDAATGKHIQSVELVGLKLGEGTPQKVYDLTLNNVTLAGYAADSGHDTALAFDYAKVTETIKGQKPDGSLDAGQTFSFDLVHHGGSIAPVNHDALAAFAHAHDGFFMV
ncbi:Type VI protein secretion system component Hcp (secreted cytotoxin) [Bradyrhizobium lablabi]|uniref:Type VI protein secretion system component Hcp (Secreted cytotoxin) n=1 Tax=Bradyrhizobium lablabi TaxID=722472 RepID=A0A1M6PGN8_9BRAD|nr:type VI secretion system tube protein Hcp [Bradyrhizobium lablabi]SHK07109.1 Type VI protein secretion system component Hcp (secreted cytotoxin) [Bradyrhizobium lablabi]